MRTPSSAASIDAEAAPESIAATEVGPYLEPLARLHRVLCPRQVLGVRMALLAQRALQVPFPQADKRVVIIVETDGCLADGLAVVSNCTIGHRTMRLADLGKIAATFVDTETEQAIRVVPRPGVRDSALDYVAAAATRWHAQREAYARMPVDELLSATSVRLRSPVGALLGCREGWVTCQRCAEEVVNGRELVRDGAILCRQCVGEGYADPR